MRRVLTALVAIPLVVAGISWAPPWVVGVAVAALAALGALELQRMAAAQGIRGLAVAGASFSALVAVAPVLGRDLAVETLTAAVLATFTVLLLERRPLEQALPAAGATLLAVAWVGLLLSYLVALHHDGRSGDLYLLLVAVWASDIGAYYVGTAFGRHRLAPRVSPAKSWEGLAGGVVATWAAVGGWWWLVTPGSGIGPLHIVPLGTAIAVAGVLGDLSESALKRGAGIKDSGGLFPGHGGVLDRVDSLLFAAPVVYHYLNWARP